MSKNVGNERTLIPIILMSRNELYSRLLSPCSVRRLWFNWLPMSYAACQVDSIARSVDSFTHAHRLLFHLVNSMCRRRWWRCLHCESDTQVEEMDSVESIGMNVLVFECRNNRIVLSWRVAVVWRVHSCRPCKFDLCHSTLRIDYTVICSRKATVARLEFPTIFQLKLRRMQSERHFQVKNRRKTTNSLLIVRVVDHAREHQL